MVTALQLAISTGRTCVVCCKGLQQRIDAGQCMIFCAPVTHGQVIATAGRAGRASAIGGEQERRRCALLHAESEAVKLQRPLLFGGCVRQGSRVYRGDRGACATQLRGTAAPSSSCLHGRHGLCQLAIAVLRHAAGAFAPAGRTFLVGRRHGLCHQARGSPLLPARPSSFRCRQGQRACFGGVNEILSPYVRC